MNSIDVFIDQYVLAIRSQIITEYMYLLTIIFDASIHFILICLCIAVLIKIVKGWEYSMLFATTLIIQAGAGFVLKILFGVSRPTGAVLEAFGNSFPSYHATAVTVFFIMLMYIFDNHLKPLGRVLFNTLCVTMVILVAFSRLYLGVHWLSDVVSGVLLGVLISYISVKLFKKFITN